MLIVRCAQQLEVLRRCSVAQETTEQVAFRRRWPQWVRGRCAPLVKRATAPTNACDASDCE